MKTFSYLMEYNSKNDTLKGYNGEEERQINWEELVHNRSTIIVCKTVFDNMSIITNHFESATAISEPGKPFKTIMIFDDINMIIGAIHIVSKTGWFQQQFKDIKLIYNVLKHKGYDLYDMPGVPSKIVRDDLQGMRSIKAWKKECVNSFSRNDYIYLNKNREHGLMGYSLDYLNNEVEAKHYDFSGLYPFMMLTHNFPCGSPETVKELPSDYRESCVIYINIIKIKFKRRYEHLNWVVNTKELIAIPGAYFYALKRASDEFEYCISAIHKYPVKPYPEEVRNYMAEQIINKSKYPRGSAERAVAKLFSNIASGLSYCADICVRNNEVSIMKKYENEPIPAYFGFWIQSFGILRLMDLIDCVDDIDDIIYDDTDSLFACDINEDKVNELNALVEDELCSVGLDYLNEYNLGKAEAEYHNFTIQIRGNKTYLIHEKDKKVKIVAAGLTKDNVPDNIQNISDVKDGLIYNGINLYTGCKNKYVIRKEIKWDTSTTLEKI